MSGFTVPYLPATGDDSAYRCIAAASILAKVIRDRIMVGLSERYPDYGLTGHKSYGTTSYMGAISRHDTTPEHRWSYRNVRLAHARYLEHSGQTNIYEESNMQTLEGAIAVVSTEDLGNYEADVELSLYKEFRDVVSRFSYVVGTERRFYLANTVELIPHSSGDEVYFELRMSDAWVWNIHRPTRFVRYARVITFKDVDIEKLDEPDL